MAFENIRKALLYIDSHLACDLTVEGIAERFHFSPYYFHRMFTAIVGKSLAAYVRTRRVEEACRLIAETNAPLAGIGYACGFSSQQAFNRAFKGQTGYAPGRYRLLGLSPCVESTDEMIRRFTNRMKGGVIVKPNIIKRPKLRIAGATGDGNRTGEVWAEFERFDREIGLAGKKSKNGYEIRFIQDGKWLVHVGCDIADGAHHDEAFAVVELPASTYASFDVYVAQGYDSENRAMDEWLDSNPQGYRQRTLFGEGYVVEYYDERFTGDGEDSIVEIWIPIEARFRALRGVRVPPVGPPPRKFDGIDTKKPFPD